MSMTPQQQQQQYQMQQMQQQQQRMGGPGGQQRGQQGNRGPPNQNRGGDMHGRGQSGPPMSTGFVAPLKMSENRWLRGVPRLDDEQERNRQIVIRQTKSILNKLTFEFFTPLKEALLALPVPDAQTLDSIIDVIFEKALDEPKFAPLYAKLCSEVHEHMAKFEVKVEPEDAGEDGEDEERPAAAAAPQQVQTITFRRGLLLKCQKWFENIDNIAELRDRTPAEKEKMKPEEIEEAEYHRLKAKRHLLGNITFIGELFKLSMLTEKIMHFCMHEFLDNISNPDEGDVECLCNLLKTIGKQLDHPKAKETMDVYFKRMATLLSNKNLSSRVRFMLQDIIDLRRDRWIPRREETKMASIDEVRQEAMNEQLEKERQRAGQYAGGRPQSGSNDRRSSSRGGMPTMNQQLGGRGGGQRNAQPPPPTPREQVDTKKLGQYTGDAAQQITLGPREGKSSLFGRGGARSPGTAMARSTSGTSSAGPQATSTNNSFEGLLNEESSDTPPSESDTLAGTVSPTTVEAPTRSETATPVGGVSKKRLNAAEFEKRIASTLSEYLAIRDKKELRLCIEELDNPEHVPKIVDTFFRASLTAKPEERQATFEALAYLLQEGPLTAPVVLKGLNVAFADLEDETIDNPELGTYAGHLLLTLVRSGGLPLDALGELSADVRSSTWADKMSAALFTGLLPSKDPAARRAEAQPWLAQLSASGLKLTDFLSARTRTTRKDYLRFLEKSDVFVFDPLFDIERSLPALLTGSAESVAECSTWLDMNVPVEVRRSPEFMRLLATLVLRAVTAKTSLAPSIKRSEPALPADVEQEERRLLQLYVPLLKLYQQQGATGDQERWRLQLEVVVALQDFSAASDNPASLPDRLSRFLYHTGVVEEDAFRQWRKAGGDEAPSAAKAAMLSRLTEFFTWLDDATEED